MAQEADAPEGEKPATPEAKEGEKPQGDEPKTFDADYVKTLRSEAASNRKRAQDAEARIEELSEQDKSELEKLTGKLSKAESKAQEAEGRLLRFQVAAEKQVPADALDLLTGSTREELEARADKILNLVKSPNTEQTPDFDGGARETAPEPKSASEAHNDLAMQLLGPAR